MVLRLDPTGQPPASCPISTLTVPNGGSVPLQVDVPTVLAGKLDLRRASPRVRTTTIESGRRICRD